MSVSFVWLGFFDYCFKSLLCRLFWGAQKVLTGIVYTLQIKLIWYEKRYPPIAVTMIHLTMTQNRVSMIEAIITSQPTCETLPSKSWKCCSAIMWRYWSLFSSLFSVLVSFSCCCASLTWLFSSLMLVSSADEALGFDPCRACLIGGSFRIWRCAV